MDRQILLPSDLVVYVVKIGDPRYARHTELFIRSYCRIHGYRLVFATTHYDQNRHPSWDKLLAFRSVESPFVLLMDLDIVPLPDSPPIHLSLCPRKLNLVRIIPGRGSQRKLRRLNYPAGVMQWNAGLIGVPSAMSGELEEVYQNANSEQEVWMEQGALNLAIFNKRIEINELSPEWNHWVRREWQPNTIQSHFLHLAGNKRRRVENARKLSGYYSSFV